MAQATIQLVSKTDHTSQRFIPHPLSTPSSPLPPSSIRIRTSLISLTTNLFFYVRGGALNFPGLDYWNAWPFPPPSTLPSEYRDSLDKYCRISAWGFATVTDSAVAEIPAGSEVWGYMPISTGEETLELGESRVAGEQGKVWLEKGERRKGLAGVYNRYYLVGTGTGTELGGGEAKKSRGLDALMRSLFHSSWMLNRWSFDWTDSGIHPLGIKQLPWSASDADLTDSVVILLAGSGKTGLSLAWLLKKCRPEGKRPRKVIVVGSEKSKGFSEKTGLFDEVLEYGDVDDEGFDLKGLIGSRPEKILVVDFGARGDAPEKWVEKLKPMGERVQVVLVGANPESKGVGSLAALAMTPGSGVAQMNAGGLLDGGLAVDGKNSMEGFEEDWEAFKNGGAAGLKLVWGRGIEEFGKGWDGLAKGGFVPDIGLVYEFP